MAPSISFQSTPLFVLTCHCRVGAGFPVAEAVKLTLVPGSAVAALGAPVTTGLGSVRVTLDAL